MVFSIVQIHFVFINLISLYFLHILYNIMIIIIVFRLGNNELFSCFFAGYPQSFPGHQSRDDSSLGGRWMIFHFQIVQVHFVFVNSILL